MSARELRMCLHVRPVDEIAVQMSTLGLRFHLSGARAPIVQHQDFYGARS